MHPVRVQISACVTTLLVLKFSSTRIQDPINASVPEKFCAKPTVLIKSNKMDSYIHVEMHRIRTRNKMEAIRTNQWAKSDSDPGDLSGFPRLMFPASQIPNPSTTRRVKIQNLIFIKSVTDRMDIASVSSTDFGFRTTDRDS